jgi:hypothetical protein
LRAAGLPLVLLASHAFAQIAQSPSTSPSLRADLPRIGMAMAVLAVAS